MARREWNRASLSVFLLERVPDASTRQALKAVKSGFRLTGLPPERGDKVALIVEESRLPDEENEHAVQIKSFPRDHWCDGLAGVRAPFPRQLRRDVHGHSGRGQGTAFRRPALLDLPGSEGCQW